MPIRCRRGATRSCSSTAPPSRRSRPAARACWSAPRSSPSPSLAICGRLVDVTLLQDGIEPRTRRAAAASAPRSPSAPISSTATASCWPPASPPPRSSPIRRRCTDADEAAQGAGRRAARSQRRRAEGQARRRQELRLAAAQPDAAPAVRRQPPRHPRPLFPGRGAARLSAWARSPRHVVGFTDIDNKGLAGIERVLRRRAGAAGAIPCSSPSTSASSRSCARSCSAAIDDFNGIGGAGIVLDAQHRRDPGHGLAARFRSRTRPATADARPALQPRHARHLRDGLDLQDRSTRPWRWTAARIDADRQLSTPPIRSRSAASRSTTSSR